VAAANLGVSDVGEDIERLIRSRPRGDAAELADPDTPLAALTAAAGRAS